MATRVRRKRNIAYNPPDFPCRLCKYARRASSADDEKPAYLQKNAVVRERWKAIECGNPKSTYYRSLVNVSIGGLMQKEPTWGCVLGETDNTDEGDDENDGSGVS